MRFTLRIRCVFCMAGDASYIPPNVVRFIKIGFDGFSGFKDVKSGIHAV